MGQTSVLTQLFDVLTSLLASKVATIIKLSNRIDIYKSFGSVVHLNEICCIERQRRFPRTRHPREHD